MSAIRARDFANTRTCPSSEDISSRRPPRGKLDQIARHVAGWEFCPVEQRVSPHTLKPPKNLNPQRCPRIFAAG